MQNENKKLGESVYGAEDRGEPTKDIDRLGINGVALFAAPYSVGFPGRQSIFLTEQSKSRGTYGTAYATYFRPPSLCSGAERATTWLAEQEVFSNPNMKLLIFIEHKDILDYFAGDRALAVLLPAIGLVSTGCAGTSSKSTPPPPTTTTAPGTPTGNYTVTIAATDGTTTKSTTIDVNVQ